jgi:hypothetical protein
MSVVLCAIAKDEDDYLDEWIEYHLRIGADHIYLYDNNDQPRYYALAEIYPGRLTVFHVPGRCMQMAAYEHFRQFARQLSPVGAPTWVAYIDIDEFIVIRGKTLPELLASHGPAAGALGLNWVLFGNNGHTTAAGRSVLQRFTRRQHGVNPHIKWIVRLADLKGMVSPHHGVFSTPGAFATDCDGTHIPENGPYHPDGNDRVACIHHYFTKSNEEFKQKCLRGRADIPEWRNVETDFHRHNFNDLEDRSALDVWYKK